MLCDIAWGIAGVEMAVDRGDVVVIVDTLSFSSAVVTALMQGVTMIPCAEREHADAIAEREDAHISVPRANTDEQNPFSLSPLSYLDATPGTHVVLVSPNGGACAEKASRVEHAYVGCLLNAQAVAEHIATVAAENDKDITVIAAGENSAHHNLPGEARLLFAIEDYLACGAILGAIMADYTAEAAVCTNAFMNSQEHLDHLLKNCIRGRQLIEDGYEADVNHCLQVNHYSCIPQIRGNVIVAHDAPEEIEQPVDDTSIQETVEEVDDMDKWPAELIALRDEALECMRCDLAETRTHVVFGEGNPRTKLMLIGEGPGDQEDKTGRPFVGRAGKLLDEALATAGIQRDDVWIGNVLKCRACVIEDGRAKNRPPRADEVKSCRPWLESQIKIIQPSVILCIGAPAANLIIHRNFKMTKERGQWFIDSPFAPNVMAALHPAYILRQHGEAYESSLQSLVDDLKVAWERSTEEPPAKPQLTLF